MFIDDGKRITIIRDNFGNSTLPTKNTNSYQQTSKVEEVHVIMNTTNCDIQSMVLKVRYHKEQYPDLQELTINPKGDFIDLRSAETVFLKAGEFKLISLGISVKLPEGYWAQVAPRSSTFKNYGILMTNSFGVIDESYCGDSDIWMMPVYATRDTEIKANDRICQFRLVKKSDQIVLETVEQLEDENRGGFGSSGKQ